MKKIFILFHLGFSIGVYAQDFLKDINFGKLGFILTDEIGLAYITVSLSDFEWTIDYNNCQVFNERIADPKNI